MTGSGHRSTRGRASSAGILVFIIVGAVLTASGTYLMLEIGNDDIGGPANAVLEASQDGGTVTIEHTAGEPIDGADLRVVGGTVGEMPAELRTGDRLDVRPTAGEVRLLFENGRVSQELVRTEVELARLVVRVADGSGSPIPSRTVGVYDLSSTPGLDSVAALRAEIDRTGEPPAPAPAPAPALVGATDADGEFVTAIGARTELELGGEYVVATATAGPAGDRTYDLRVVQVGNRENTVSLVVPG